MSERVPDESRQNPFRKWLRYAYENAVRLRLPEEVLHESVRIVESALTTEWIRSVLARSQPKDGMIPRFRHHFYPLLRVPGDPHVIELLELARYLARLAQTPGIEDVISTLKADYTAALLQLAFAYRFVRSGAHDAELEPRTDRGKSDIYFQHGGRSFLVEVYCPRKDTETDAAHVMSIGFRRIFLACKDIGRSRAIGIRLAKSLTPKEAKALSLVIADQVRRNRHRSEPLAFSHHCAHICIAGETAEVLGEEQPGPDFVTRQFFVAQKDALGIELGRDPSRETEGSSIMIWRPGEEIQAVCKQRKRNKSEILIKAIDKKLRQAKRSSDRPGRILVVTVDPRPNREYWESVGREVQQRLVPKYADIAAIILAQRRWVATSRYQYQCVFAMGAEEASLPQSLYRSLGKAEGELDVVGDSTQLRNN
jgi:hypothetical protein